ncbi:MAG TPA: phosphotyrosine protein phosphatase [Gammaproteobacteria bacterium]|nr:phosphotyrosine protein phosphatase [Gammaproteobacteria bacterium]
MDDTAKKLELPFMAGLNPMGEPVFESLQAELLDEQSNRVRLLKSPLLSRSLAAGDILRIINPNTAEYEMERHSGNLSVRVFRKSRLSELEEHLTSAIEKLGGSLDFDSERALVYSIHVSLGFGKIEELLNNACEKYPDSVWYYGNVYDPKDGTTPLNWWHEFDNQE